MNPKFTLALILCCVSAVFSMSVEPLSRAAIISCSNAFCGDAFVDAVSSGCQGNQCKAFIKQHRPDCIKCVDELETDFYDVPELEIGVIMCLKEIKLHRDMCNFICRRKFSPVGSCKDHQIKNSLGDQVLVGYCSCGSSSSF